MGRIVTRQSNLVGRGEELRQLATAIRLLPFGLLALVLVVLVRGSYSMRLD